MRYFIVILLCIAFKADGQIIRANPFHTKRAVAVATDTLLLDSFPNAAAAYSLRKLKTLYSGSAIRIRRDSTGNAETDIGFLASGELDTNAIKTHCRNNSCMVTTWYNQGDSASVDFTQTTAASQPRIMTTGIIERRNGKPAIRFDNSGTVDFMSVASSTVKFNYLHKTGQAASFGVIQFGNVSNPNDIYSFYNNNNNSLVSTGHSIYWDDRSSVPRNNEIVSIVRTVSSNSSGNNFYAPDTLALLTNLLDNSNATAANRNLLYRNGTNEKKNNSISSLAQTGNAAFNMRLGAGANTSSFPLNGFVSELIFYPIDQKSNRTGIETNIKNFYGL